MQGFRLNAKRVFLTFSQVGDRGELNLIQGYHLAMLLPVSYYLLSKELHQDGGVHYHLVIVFKEKVNIVNAKYFDWMFDDVHPNIVPIKHGNKDMQRCIAYVKKDKDFIEDGSDPCVTPKDTTMVRLSKLILSGKTLDEIDVLEPVAMIMHAPKVAASIARLNERNPPALLEWVPPSFSDSLQFGSPQDMAIYNIKLWLNERIRKECDPRAEHLWIWGTGKIGKSRLCSQLGSMLRVFDVPDENKEQMTGYSDTYDLVIFDDYHHSKSVTFLKKFLQGYPMKVAQKTIGPYYKKKNIPCLFTSNKPPSEAYKFVSVADPAHFIPLLERLIVVNVTEFNLFP